MDRTAWVARHLRLAERLSVIAANPEGAKSPARRTRAGDLVVLGSSENPRVRVVLEVVPSGGAENVKVFDYANGQGERQFRASHVRFASWLRDDDRQAGSANAR
jgi:hypothetical protein